MRMEKSGEVGGGKDLNNTNNSDNRTNCANWITMAKLRYGAICHIGMIWK